MDFLKNELHNENKDLQCEMEKECQRVFSQFQSVEETNILRLMDASLVSCCAQRNEVSVRFPIKKWQLNPNMTFHGGLIATCFDTAFGLLVRVLTQHGFISTIDLSVSYLRPVRLDDDFVIVAKANHVGKTIVRVSAEAFVGGNMVATSNASFILMKQR